MPTRDQVLQVPFVGGIDEYTDPDQLQPPGMQSMTNCVIRKTGRIEKREGFEYLPKLGVPGVPADAFGNSSGPLPTDHEALGTNSGKDGSRLLLAASNTLYEYVGSDANHGFRDVNRIPSCYGTLHPVDATGGDIIEVESMLDDAGAYRCTVWVLGVRNGQDLTNDRAISSQPVGTHGIYVAVQRVSDGSFVLPPTRIKNSAGTDATQVCDLRMTKAISASGGVRHWVIAFRNEYTNVCACVVNSTDWSLKPTVSIGTLIAPRYWRAFDITNVPSQAYMLLAICGSDSWVSSSDVAMSLVSFNATTGAFSTVYSMPGGALDAANAYGSTTLSVHDWNRRTPRGVVLETEPSSDVIAMAVRTIYEMDTAPFYLDGKFVTMRADCGGSTISFTFDSFAWLHRVGFQTEENFSSFKATSNQEKKFSQNASATGQSLSASVPSVSSSSTAIVTARFWDGSTQPYSVGRTAGALGPALTPQSEYVNPIPYLGVMSPQIEVTGLYPKPVHSYPPSNSVGVQAPNIGAVPTLTTATIDQRNVTRVELGLVPAAVGYPNSTRYCRLSSASGVRCLAVVQFDAAGIPVATALYDGEGAGNVAGNPAFTDITSLEVSAVPYGGPWAAPVAVPPLTIGVFDDFNSPSATGNTNIVFNDIGSNAYPVQQSLVETDVGIEQCVHRWDVKTAGESVILAVSSTSAGTFSSPNGDAPLGYVSPFARSNYFEVYPWLYNTDSRRDLNDYCAPGSSTSRPIWCALGGPWRMTGGLVSLTNGRYGCVLMPSGDDYQKSAFFVSFVYGNASVETLLDLDGQPIIQAGGVVYTDNKGVFVESLNMPRVASVPLNCARFSYTYDNNLLCVGAVRQGASVGGDGVFAIQYSFSPSSWRVIKQFGDYSVVNGGIVSSFDGSSCNEASMLLWPQRDMSSIAYDRQMRLALTGRPDITLTPGYTTLNSSVYRMYTFGGPFLANISRPFFTYEAGLKEKNEFTETRLNSTGAITPMYWSQITTSWGGDPTKDYQTVYADPRLNQVSGGSNLNYNSGAGISQVGNSHYYGRYQSGYGTLVDAGYTIRLSLWTPRSTDQTTSLNDSQYSPTVANGDFLARWCYEFVDGTGRTVKSSPSQAVTFTICAAIRYSMYKPDPDAVGEVPVNGGVVDEYRYGFFVPRLELTNRLKTASSDSKRAVIQPYFTAEPFASVFYKVPFSSFLPEYSNDFTISRNVTRGIVPYSSFNAGVALENPYGIVTNNLKCFDGPLGDYNGLLSQPVLYTVGGGLDNVAPPSALCMTVHQNRLVLGGADDATVVWFSKELSPTDAPGFNDALTIQIDDGGAVTGLASMEGILVIFKRDMTWLVPGDMPDDTGGAINRGYVSNTLGTPVRMPHGIGCVDHRSVVETPVGIFFKSERTIELLSRDMSITPIGLKLDDTLSYRPNVVAAFHNAKDTEVWFSLADNSGHASPVFAVYNYTAQTWYMHSVNTGTFGAFSTYGIPSTIMDGNVYFAATWLDPLGSQPNQTVVYKQTENKFFDETPEGRFYVSMSWRTAPIAVNNVQGFQRVKRVRVFGNPIPTLSTGAAQERNPHGAQFTVQTDYATSVPNNGTQVASWTEAETAAVYADQNREVYEVHLREQKGQSVTLQYNEVAPANLSTLTTGYGTAFSNMSFVVGLKAGLDKRITPGAKH